MEPTLCEIKPDYFIKKTLCTLSLVIAIGIIAFGIIKPNYHIIVLSIFFFIVPALSSNKYLKIFRNRILIETKSVYPFLNSIKRINLNELVELSYYGKESRVFEDYFMGSPRHQSPENVQPISDEHIRFKYKDGTDYRLFKIGRNVEFKQAFDVILRVAELSSLNIQLGTKERKEKVVELIEPESINSKSNNVIFEIKPSYQSQLTIKYLLFTLGIFLEVISLLMPSIAYLAFIGLIMLIATGFYILFSSKRYLTIYDDRVEFKDLSIVKDFSKTTTVFFSQVCEVFYLKKQFLIFAERVPTSNADNQTLYNENRIVFKMTNNQTRVIKHTGEVNDFIVAFEKIKKLVETEINKENEYPGNK